MDVHLDLRFRPSARAPAAARRSLEALEEKLEPGLFENVKLLVSELVTNSIRHGELDRDDWVEVRVTADPECVTVIVIDRGRGYLPDRTVPRMNADSGWGLYLVDRIADRWGVEDNGKTTVWFELRRTPGRSSASGSR